MIYGIFVPPWLHMRCYDASKRRTAARTETRGVARCRSVALASGAGADEIVERALWEVKITIYVLRFIFRKNIANRAKVHAIHDERFKESVYTTGVEYERGGVACAHEDGATAPARPGGAGDAVRGRRCSLLLINDRKLRAASALPLIPVVEGRRAGGQKLEG